MNITKTQHTRIVKLLAKGITQAEIAEQVGVTRYFVSQTKLGRIAPYGKSKPGTSAGTAAKKTSKRATPKKTAKRTAAKRAKKLRH